MRAGAAPGLKKRYFMETIGAEEFYNRLALAFDVMTDWPKRLTFEMPFLERNIRAISARSILDMACGTGWHSIALAQKGYLTAGCDISSAMIHRARQNAAESGVGVLFEVADFSQLGKIPGAFDFLLCLGNSLPHVLSESALREAFQKMKSKIKRGGGIIIHNLNYDLRLKKQPRFFAAEGNAEVLVWRFADYGTEFLTFHTALFERNGSKSPQWSVKVNSTLQKPWLTADLDRILTEEGFQKIEHFGGLDGSAYEPDTSGDLVIVASC
ncbi:MAG: putative methyltransferase [Deltaproteobacteria bacterium]|nr:putative methyltransferase [Deltaproteobacteria bacterium]